MFFKSLGLLLAYFSFMSTSLAQNQTPLSFEELCKLDSMCYLLKDQSGNIKQPHRILMFLLQGYRKKLIELGTKYNIHPALPVAAIVTEHSINVGIEDVIQDSLSQTMFTRNGAFLGIKEMSFGFGQLYNDAALEAETKIAALENRKPDRNIIRERIKSIEGSLEYVAALMSAYIEKYEEAGYQVRNNIGVVSTLYNIGKIDSRIERTKKERRDPGVNYFGWFVVKYWDEFNKVLSEESSINLLTATDTPSAQENNTDYSGTDGKIRWLISSLNSTPVYARLQTQNPIRLFYQPFRCHKNQDLRNNFVNQSQTEVTIINASSISKLSFKTEAKGFFQPQAINFDCFGNPWVLLSFDTGQSGWVDFKSIQSSIEYKYEEVSCNQKQQQQCFAQIKSLINENDEFKNFIGESVILKEDNNWGQIHIQLAPGKNTKKVELQTSYTNKSCERLSQKQDESDARKSLDSYAFGPQKNETVQEAYLKYTTLISGTTAPHTPHTPQIKFEEYLQKKITSGLYGALKPLSEKELSILDSIVEKVFKDPMFVNLNLKMNTDSYLALEEYIANLNLRSLHEQVKWMKSYLEVCYKKNNDVCYYSGIEKLLEYAVPYLNRSVWEVYADTYSIGGSYATYNRSAFYSKSKLYESWQNEVSDPSIRSNNLNNDLSLIKKHCQEVFDNNPRLKQHFDSAIAETLYTFKDHELYNTVYIEEETINTLANACVFVDKLKQQRLSIKNIQNLALPFPPKRSGKTHTFKIKLNDKSQDFPHFSTEQIIQLPLTETQVDSIVESQIDILKSSLDWKIQSRIHFAKKYYGSSLQKESYHESMCTYSLTSTFKRIQALSELPCVETIYIPEEDSLLPSGIRYNLPITVFPFSEKDRFIVQAQKACRSR